MTVMNGDTVITFHPNVLSPPAELAALTHPDYRHRFAQWSRIRDCIEGEDVIKAARDRYLPKRARQKDDSYLADLTRAVFFNATGRTQQALLSSIFRRPGVVRLPEGMSTESVTQDGMSLRKVQRWLAEELIAVTRAGAYLDLPAGERSAPTPYLCLYPAEHILSWVVDAGVKKMILLAERVVDAESTMNMFNIKRKWRCRMLALDENGEYFQLTGTPEYFSAMKALPAEGRIYPTVYGKRLRSIPFEFFGAVRNGGEVEKPLLLDIVDMNLKHYVASANLERSRAFVGSPIYTTYSNTKGDDDEGPMVVSPEIIWEFSAGDKAEILEFKGSALSSLENGMEEKEEQMRVLGARLVGQRKNAAARSSGAEDAAAASDDATLLDVVESVSDGLTRLFRLSAEWQRLNPKKVLIILNKHFSTPNIGARELRAIDACLNRSLRPEDIFDLLVESGLIKEDQDKDEYVKWIEDLREQQEAATRAKLNQPVTPPAKSGPAPGSTNSS